MFKTAKLLLSFLLLMLNGTIIFAQNFEWASSGSNLLKGFSHSCITIDGRLITGMDYETPSYRISDDDVAINSGTGKVVPLNYYQNQMLVTCYSSEGEIDWMIQSGRDIGGARILGLTSMPDGNVVIAYRSHLIRIPFQVVGEKQSNANEEKEIDINDFVFFSTISKSGEIKQTYAISGVPNREWSSFVSTPDLGFLIAQPSIEKVKDANGRSTTVAFYSTIKLKKDFTAEWHHKVTYSSESCCSFFIPSNDIAIGDNGDVFITGNIRKSYTVDGSKPRQVPILDTPSQYNPPYESYVGCLDSKGKLKWIKYSGAKGLVFDISVQNKHIVIGGRIQLAKKFFDMPVDTTESKKAFLMSFDLSGKTEWIKTFNAEEVNAVCQDQNNNVFGVFRSKRSVGMSPLKIGTDTLPDSYQRIIVGSFDENGNYRWLKSSKANISINSQTRIHSDLCGNLYYTGEMWFVLPINMALLDGAIASGKGYGGAPIAARLRTTIPDELLSLNQGLVQTIKLKNETRNRNAKNDDKSIKSSSNNPPETDQANNPNNDQTKSGRELSCVEMPFPWKIDAFPVPTNGPLTLRASLSYTDPYVKIDLFDVKGAFIKNLMPVQLKDAGEFEFTLDASDLSSGVYLAVLRGSSFGASCKFVVTK